MRSNDNDSAASDSTLRHWSDIRERMIVLYLSHRLIGSPPCLAAIAVKYGAPFQSTEASARPSGLLDHKIVREMRCRREIRFLREMHLRAYF
jgi:hypothetical protein